MSVLSVRSLPAQGAASLNLTPEFEFQRAIFCHWQEI
jgi:hypothetical protein